MKKKILASFIFVSIIIIYWMIVFKYNSDFLIYGTNFFDILMTFTAICGVFGIIYQSNQSNKLNEAQFIFNLNQQYINNIAYQKLLDKLETNSADDYSSEYNDLIAQCLDFFESLYILLKNGSVNIALIDDLFCFRFFTIVNNRYVQENVLTPHKEYYKNIVCLHYLWKNYKLKKGSNPNIPLIDSDLSFINWYRDICKHQKKYIPISNSLAHIALVREALPEDADSIKQLYHQLDGQCIINVDIEEQLSRINQSNKYFFIASVNGRIIGTIQCTICRSVVFDGSSYMLIENFVIDKQYRFKGIGTILFGKAKRIAKEINVKSIVVIPNRKIKFFNRSCGEKGI